MRSLWIPFEIGSFWTTEKPIVLILGPDLTPDNLPGPLKGWLSISVENDQAFAQLNAMINQLEKKLDSRQNVNRRRRDRHLNAFLTEFKAWKPKRKAVDLSQQAKIDELTEKLETQERSQNEKITEIEQASQTQIEAKEVNSERDETKSFTADLGNGINLEMIAIPGGKFRMGSPEGEGDDNEKPQHEVTITPFFLGKYSITQAQYQQVIGHNPSFFKGDDLPVEQVSWDEAVKFCQRLTKQTGTEYRLPTEAEWEYACRGGTTTPYHFGDRITDQLANYNGNIGKTTPVGTFPANAFGLYDMHGNVWEWCQDDWYGNYNNAPQDGTARTLATGIAKVIRGGSWGLNPNGCRSAIRLSTSRDGRRYFVGFRIVCVVSRTT